MSHIGHSYPGFLMPTKAGTPCNNRTCTGVAHNGACAKCGSQRRGKDRAYDTHRGTAAERGYDSTWRKLRTMQLSMFPLCGDCIKGGGRVTVATEVHHIIAKRDGGTNSFDNLMSLCKSCHSKRTAQGE
jgi:5-methylcytosine-specific restriction protein A